MDVFVVTCLGTPISVEWTMMHAESMVDSMVQSYSKDRQPRESFRIFSVPLQDPYVWIIDAMSRAAIVAKEHGDKPVVIPAQTSAFLWAVSEIGEAADALVHEMSDWKRNNPERHGEKDFETEVSHAIMMLILAQKADFFKDIKAQLAKWGFVDDVYKEPI